MEAEQNPPRLKKIPLIAGIIFLSGSAVFWLRPYWKPWFEQPVPGRLSLRFQGNKQISSAELSEVIQAILGDHRGAGRDQIANLVREGLSLNPRLEGVKAEFTGESTLVVTVSEIPTDLIFQLPEGMLEASASGRVLQEGGSKNLPIFPEMPIFYLTDGQSLQKSLLIKDEKGLALQKQPLLRDIISLWQETRGKYAFIWQRISELRLDVSSAVPQILLFGATKRVRIHLNETLDKSMLLRLWAVFFHLEKQEVTQGAYAYDVLLEPTRATVYMKDAGEVR